MAEDIPETTKEALNVKNSNNKLTNSEKIKNFQKKAKESQFEINKIKSKKSQTLSKLDDLNLIFEVYQKDYHKIIEIIKNEENRINDLRNLSREFNFDQILGDVYFNLKNVGFELIKTKFLDQQFYILTSDGKDDNITPSQYGILALIIALSKEVDENIKIKDLKEIFVELWDSDVQFLINNDYLRKFDEVGIIKVTPMGKATMKNVIKDLQLKNLINLFENK
ncbi:hypothetical protein ES703_30995 [subsurface metagenome]